jgi:hypothetical protein
LKQNINHEQGDEKMSEELNKAFRAIEKLELKPVIQQPPAEANAAYRMELIEGNSFRILSDTYPDAKLTGAHALAQTILDALNFVSGAESELKPEGSLPKVLTELFELRRLQSSHNEAVKAVEWIKTHGELVDAWLHDYESRMNDGLRQAGDDLRTLLDALLKDK